MNKPVIDPHFPGGELEGWRRVDDSNPADIEAFDVKFDDCDTPWVICRHKDSQMNISWIVERLSVQPVRFRSFV